jgi:hypothetical protein
MIPGSICGVALITTILLYFIIGLKRRKKFLSSIGVFLLAMAVLWGILEIVNGMIFLKAINTTIAPNGKLFSLIQTIKITTYAVSLLYFLACYFVSLWLNWRIKRSGYQ